MSETVCSKCGSIIPEGDQFCPNCGQSIILLNGIIDNNLEVKKEPRTPLTKKISRAVKKAFENLKNKIEKLTKKISKAIKKTFENLKKKIEKLTKKQKSILIISLVSIIGLSVATPFAVKGIIKTAEKAAELNRMFQIEDGTLVDFNEEIAIKYEVYDIKIPNSVTSIGHAAFEGCSSLESIVIPNSVTSIGYEAFRGCNSLESITIPFVGQYADGSGAGHFGYIFGASRYDYNDKFVPSSLKEVIITGGTTIRDYAFRYCTSLESIVIPNSVTSIGNHAFYGCSSLKSIVIPNSVTSIREAAFYECTSLESVVIPNSVASIGNYAFRNCSSLESIVIPNSVTSIGGAAFYECTSLESIVIPNSVTSIGDISFAFCTSLKTVTFEENSQLASIGNFAFEGCIYLESIVIPNSVTSIGNYAFSGCFSLTIYCEAEHLPSGWDAAWNSDYRPVYWAGQWEYDANGNPVPII